MWMMGHRELETYTVDEDSDERRVQTVLRRKTCKLWREHKTAHTYERAN
jgi:hypothetical protein